MQIDRLIKFSLLLFIFILPLLGSTNSFGYEQIKVLFLILSISLIGFLTFIYLLKNPLFKGSGIIKAAGLFIVILFVTSILGINPGHSILGTQPYFQGWILYVYLFLFCFLVSLSKIKIEKWALCLGGSAAIVGLLAIGEWIQINLLGYQLPGYAGRVVSTFGQPNFYSGFILLTLPFWYFLLKKNIKNWVIINLGFLISVVAIIISESKSAYLFLGALIFMWLILELKNYRFAIVTTSFIVIILAIFASFYFQSGLIFKQITQPLNVSDLDLIHLTNTSVEQRIYIWPLLIDRIRENPVTGYGLENISVVYSNFFQKNFHSLFEENLHVSPLLIRLKDLYIDRAHNYILDLLLFSGILGLLGWGIMVFMVAKKIILSKISLENNVLLVGLITYFFWIQFQNQSVVHLVYFWLLVGIIDSL